MKLHPVEDGVTRNPDERGVTPMPWYMTGHNRDSLVGDKKQSDKPATTTRYASLTPDGTAYEFSLDRFGNETNRRASRTVEMGDQPLRGLARIMSTDCTSTKSGPTSSPRVPKSGTKTNRVTSGIKSEKGTTRDNSMVDSVIRKTGYTGPITTQLRRLARDSISHRESLARYAATC